MSDHLHRILAGDRFELKLAAALASALICLALAAWVVVDTWRCERDHRELNRPRK